MFFKAKKKKSEKDLSVSPKVQTAEGWKRMMIRKLKEPTKKKS
jgi:hypothetical protein